jgi:hypothetical protein
VLQITPDLDFEKSGIVDVVVSLSPESGRHEVPIGATVSGAVIAREVYDFLTTLAAAYPGSAAD